MNEGVTDEQRKELDILLAQDGYDSIDEWMRDSNYGYDPDAGEWYDSESNDYINGKPDDWNQFVDPYTQYYYAKEAESDNG